MTADLGGAFLREAVALDAEFARRFHSEDAAGSALLSALARSKGKGLPLLDGIWPEVATTVSGSAIPLTHQHAKWLLREGGHLIVEDGDGHQAVYRLFHEAMNEFFRSRESAPEIPERIASALQRQVDISGGWAHVNPYVVRHMAAHLNELEHHDSLDRLLINFEWLSARLLESGIQEVLLDFSRSTSASGPVRAIETA